MVSTAEKRDLNKSHSTVKRPAKKPKNSVCSYTTNGTSVENGWKEQQKGKVDKENKGARSALKKRKSENEVYK